MRTLETRDLKRAMEIQAGMEHRQALLVDLDLLKPWIVEATQL